VLERLKVSSERMWLLPERREGLSIPKELLETRRAVEEEHQNLKYLLGIVNPALDLAWAICFNTGLSRHYRNSDMQR
jgi:hypothetical protein